MSDQQDLPSVLVDIRDHPGQDLYQDWTELQWTLAVLESHYDDLLGTTAKLKNALTPDRKTRQKVIGEREVDVVRSFQGYFSCAYTLYEQAQYLKNSHLCLQGGEDYCDCEACSTVVHYLNDYDILPRWEFLKRLRAYFQHRRSPNLIQPQGGPGYGSKELLLEVDQTGSIILKPEGFVAFQGNSGSAVEYVSQRGEMDLIKEVQEFHGTVFEYYDWYHGFLRSSNEQTVNEWENLISNLLSIIEKGDPDATTRQDLRDEEVRSILESLRQGGHQFRSVIDQFPNTEVADTFPSLTDSEIRRAFEILSQTANT